MEKENRRFKDSVFRRLFEDPKEIPALYKDITKKEIRENAKIEIVTLTDTMYMSHINDLGFTVDGKLIVLVEQQSSYNANMPLRMLMYIAREYEKLVDRESAYRSTIVKIPAPEFYVLYLGDENGETVEIQELKNAFECDSQSDFLNLKVFCLNINSNEFKKPLTKESKLYQYVYVVNEFAKSENKRECIEKLISENYLSDFLRKNASEVVNMLTIDFDRDLFGKIKKEEGIEIGLKKGLEKGREKGREEERLKIIEKLKKKGYSDKEIEDILK